MARKATAPREPGEPQRQRHLNAEQCKMAAARISTERRTYEAEFVRYAQTNVRDGFPGAFVPIWPADFDRCVEKIRFLYHPEEAAIIIENLTA
jgi:hypothetical protein